MNTLFPIPAKSDGIQRDAYFTKSGERRFMLIRQWVPEEDPPYVLFVMLNPSTANAEKDDPTIRKCMKYVRDWGYGCLHVMNLWDKITPSPTELLAWTKSEEERLRTVCSPNLDIGILEGESQMAAITVCGWGAWGAWFPERVRQVHGVLRDPHALHITKDGHPGHPLYLPAGAAPVKYQLPNG